MKCIRNRNEVNIGKLQPNVGHRVVNDLTLCAALDVCSQLLLKYLHLDEK